MKYTFEYIAQSALAIWARGTFSTNEKQI